MVYSIMGAGGGSLALAASLRRLRHRGHRGRLREQRGRNRGQRSKLRYHPVSRHGDVSRCRRLRPRTSIFPFRAAPTFSV